MAVELGVAYLSILPETSKFAATLKKSLASGESEATKSGASVGAKFSAALAGAIKKPEIPEPDKVTLADIPAPVVGQPEIPEPDAPSMPSLSAPDIDKPTIPSPDAPEIPDAETGGFSSSLKSAMGPIGALAGGALAAGIVGGLADSVLELESGGDLLAAQLGLGEKESARLGHIAGKLYSGAYGDSLGGVNDALRNVFLNVPGFQRAASTKLEGFTAKVLDQIAITGESAESITAAVSQLMRTGIAKTATAATDIITTGFQQGLNKNDDFLDTLNEYGTQFRKLGLSGTDVISLLSQGLRGGARDVDIVADALKEFSLRALTPLTKQMQITVHGASETVLTTTALGQAFEDAGVEVLRADGQFSNVGMTLQQDLASGGKRARAAVDLLLDGMRNVKDPVRKAADMVALFGTQSEDMGGALDKLDLDKTARGMDDIQGSTKRAGNTLADNASTKITSWWRTVKTKVVQFIADAVLPAFNDLADFINDTFGPALKKAMEFAKQGDWKKAWKAIQPIFKDAWQWITEHTKTWGDKLADVAYTIGIKIGGRLADGIVASIESGLEGVVPGENASGGTLLDGPMTNPNRIEHPDERFFDFPTVPRRRRRRGPRLAQGGRVTGPTLALIGEGRDAETVLPDALLKKLVASVAKAALGGGGKGGKGVRGAGATVSIGFNAEMAKEGAQDFEKSSKVVDKALEGTGRHFDDFRRGVLRDFNDDWTATFRKDMPDATKDMSKDVQAISRDTGGVLRDFGNTVKRDVAPAFKAGVDAVAGAWAKVESASKSPIRFVITTVLNKGLLGAFNKIAKYVDIDPLKPIPLPAGFSSGGYTGRGRRNKPAGIVHADEFVVKSDSQRKIERENPGLLEHINKHGTAKGYRRRRGDGIGGDLGDEPRLRRDLGFRAGGKVETISPEVHAAFEHGLDFARGAQGGYVYGGVGPVGYDCSGFMGAIANVIAGRLPPYYRIGTSASAPAWPGFAAGPGLFSVGYTAAYPGSSMGHVAGTLMGVNVESSGDVGPHVGGTRGANDPNFAGIMHMGPDVPLSALGGGATGSLPVLPAWAQKIVADAKAWAAKLLDGGDRLSGGFGKLAQSVLNKLITPSADWATTQLGTVGGGVAGGIYHGNHAGLNQASPEVAKSYARKIMPRLGWGADQWPYWLELGNLESGWVWHATNPKSGAYGIPQSLPPSKMAASGPDWVTNAGTQIDWMANYIRTNANFHPNNPQGAMAFHNANGWYDNGGWLKPGESGMNSSRRPEPVFSGAQWDTLRRYIPTDPTTGQSSRRHQKVWLVVDGKEFSAHVEGGVVDVLTNDRAFAAKQSRMARR